MKKILCCFLVVLSSFQIYAQDAFVVNDFVIELVINEYGDCEVYEKINVFFKKERRGIIRDIPLEGKFKTHRQKLSISDVSVKDHKYKVSRKGGRLNIRIGDPDVYLSGPIEYQISYTARNGILNFENHEELYWTLIGTEWEADIINSSFKINLPKPLELGQNDLQVFSGDVGDNTSYGKIDQFNSSTVGGGSLVTLGKGKGLTVGLRFPKGYFFENPNSSISTDEDPGFKKDNSYPFPILILLGLLYGFRKWGRNHGNIQMQDLAYYPPPDMSPAEVGTFYDNKVNNRDIISLIPKWGQEGLIRVKVLDNGDVYLERTEKLPSLDNPHESYFFDELFAGKQFVFVDELKNEFYREFAKTKSLLKKDIDPGLYDQEAVKRFHGLRMVLFSLLMLTVGVLALVVFKQFYTFLGFLGVGLAALVIRFLEPKKSDRGLRVHNQLKGLHDFLKDPSPEVMSKITNDDPDYLEKIFPYVVAFGLEEQFSKQFEGLSQKAPDWYYYEDGRHYGYGDFHRDFDTKSIGKTMSSVPVADSGSSSFGGSGGGSVGGGFGGGGGSSW